MGGFKINKKAIRTVFTRFREIGILLAFLFLFLLLSVSTDSFFQLSNIIIVIRYSVFTGILALGAVFMLSQGDIDLSVGGIYNLVGLLMLVLMERGWPVSLVVVVALLTGIICGLFNMSLSIGFKIPMLIITLGTMNIYRGLGLVLNAGRPKTGYPLDNFLFNILGGTFLGIPFGIFAFLFLILILFYIFGFTRFGIHVRSIGGNLIVAKAMGIKISKTRITASIINGSLAAISSILTFSYLRTSLPSFGNGYELIAIAAAIIGGTALAGGSGSIFGAALGALVISLIVNGIAHVGISTYWSAVVTGTIIILAVAIDYLSKKGRQIR
jgi:ribose/xylose/arabinose/galactoside ABC-type transport system permease subunit